MVGGVGRWVRERRVGQRGGGGKDSYVACFVFQFLCPRTRRIGHVLCELCSVSVSKPCGRKLEETIDSAF